LAAREPDRVSALALVSPDTWAPNMETSTSPVPPIVNNFVSNVMLRSDLAMWLMAKFARPVLLGFLALPPEVAARLTPE
jgi:pimeloyl-ACP methyl ester carboxylesterase